MPKLNRKALYRWTAPCALVCAIWAAPLHQAEAATLTRGPYLQSGSDTQITVRWRSDTGTDSSVFYGTDMNNLSEAEVVGGSRTEHVVVLTGLSPNTRYYYSVGSSGERLAGGDADHHFYTAPVPGTKMPTRIWVLGDSGTANGSARAVRNAYLNFTGATRTNLWLMLGDNAYTDGRDSEYQAAVFDTYPGMLRTSVLWPTIGNHDAASADSNTESGVYYDIFSLPRQAEVGGVMSGTEAYYSFDYANVHFVVLDSQGSNRRANGPMLQWLQADLAATAQDWIIAYWHHPPYSKGSHDSDVSSRESDMRANALPILEEHGADLVLGGHSHGYERSFLIDGHYGRSDTFNMTHVIDGGDGRLDGDGQYDKPSPPGTPHEGTVYVVAGSSGKLGNGDYDHPAMFISMRRLGSMVLDVNGQSLDAKFLNDQGVVEDYFTMHKGECMPAQVTELSCSDGQDNDCDALVDCDDPDCSNDAYCRRETFTIDEIHDATVVEAMPGANQGSANSVVIDTTERTHGMIRPASLDAIPPDATLIAATLELRVFNEGNDVELYAAEATWDENSVTWDTRPPVGAAAVGRFTAGTGPKMIDVTATFQSWLDGAVLGGFELRPTGSNGVDFFSSEADAVEFRPRFVVEIEGPDLGGTTAGVGTMGNTGGGDGGASGASGVSGGSGSGSGSGSGVSGSGASGGLPPTGSATISGSGDASSTLDTGATDDTSRGQLGESGCGCTTGGESGGGWAWMLVGVGVPLVRRRRRAAGAILVHHHRGFGTQRTALPRFARPARGIPTSLSPQTSGWGSPSA